MFTLDATWRGNGNREVVEGFEHVARSQLKYAVSCTTYMRLHAHQVPIHEMMSGQPNTSNSIARMAKMHGPFHECKQAQSRSRAFNVQSLHNKAKFSNNNKQMRCRACHLRIAESAQREIFAWGEIQKKNIKAVKHNQKSYK